MAASDVSEEKQTDVFDGEKQIIDIILGPNRQTLEGKKITFFFNPRLMRNEAFNKTRATVSSINIQSNRYLRDILKNARCMYYEDIT